MYARPWPHLGNQSRHQISDIYPESMRRSWVTMAVLLVAALGACSSTDAPIAAQPIVASATPSASASPDDPPGSTTCHLLVQAVTDASLLDPGVVDAIKAAGATADAPVADS